MTCKAGLFVGPLLVLLFAACPPCEGELRVAGGSEPVAPGQSLELAFYLDDALQYGPDACGGYWYVDQIEGGDDTVGTVTDCGLYTAPATPSAATVTVMAATYPLGECSDCCPHATRDIQLAAAGQ